MESPVPCLICKDPAVHPRVEEEVIFVVRQVLQVPECLLSRKRLEECASCLSLCAECRQLVGECREVDQQPCNRKWNECRDKLLRKVKITAAGLGEEEPAPGGGQDVMRLEIRRFVVNHMFAFCELDPVGEEHNAVPPGEHDAPGMNIEKAVTSGEIGVSVDLTSRIKDESVVESQTQKKVRKGRPQTFECLFCRRELTCNSQLIKHMRIHTRERPFWCGVCAREYCTAGNLKFHQRIHTGEKSPLLLSLECLFCRKKFSKGSELERHIRVHTGERPFWCGVCSQEFNDVGSLNRHQRLHTGEKPHLCKLCGKRFIQSGDLSLHVRRHLGEKPCKCPDCGKAFGEKEDVAKHRVVHTGERPYQCKLCLKTFKQSSHLLSHRKKMH